MTPEDIKRKVCDRIDTDNAFAVKLGGAIENGLWDIVAELISDVLGYIIGKACDFIEWLKDNW